MFKTSFGDTATATTETNEVIVGLTTFDSLEYDCWDLIKKYGEYFGIKIESEEGIDFYAAKEVQETVLKLFTDAGFKFVSKGGKENE